MRAVFHRSCTRAIEVCALLLAVFASHAGHAQAQSSRIENTASARWDSADDNGETRSNSVAVTVVQPAAEVSLWTSSPESNQTISFSPAVCPSGSPIAASNASGDIISLGVEQSATVTLGRDLIIRVSAPRQNADSNAIEQIEVRISVGSGDQERLQLFETGLNTGEFAGSIASQRFSAQNPGTNCRLEARSGETILVSVVSGNGTLGRAQIDVLADPFGVVFDSETGAPVSGARISMVDANTGEPALVFAEDGQTRWPSTVISGETIVDEAGTAYPMEPGEYWFPLTPLGDYRIEVDPPGGYTTPSIATPEQLANLVRNDGVDFVIQAGSFGGVFSLEDEIPIEIDIPADPSTTPVAITKMVSRERVQPGDTVFFTVEVRNEDPARTARGVMLVDTLPSRLRYRVEAFQLDGVAIERGTFPHEMEFAADGSGVELRLGDLAPGQTRRFIYAATVRPDARSGRTESFAEARDQFGQRSRASVSLQVERDLIAGTMTIIGRVTRGACSVNAEREGVAGVRLALEDGSFVITDADGRYHFEGLTAGTHIVRALDAPLPGNAKFVDCAQSTRSLGKANMRLVEGQGGALMRADFFVQMPDESAAEVAAGSPSAPRIPVAAGEVLQTETYVSSGTALGLEIPDLQSGERISSLDEVNWLELGDGPDGWLAPAADANPRIPAIRVAIRHRKGQTVRLFVDGEPVNPLLFYGTAEASEGSYAVSLWRGVPLVSDRTELTAEIVNSLGGVNQTLERIVYFTSQPAFIELVPELSQLVADGRTRPILGVRITDAAGRPLREGVSGQIVINSPYQSAEQIERRQIAQLNQVGPTAARWVTEGDQGIVRIELAPTMVSGRLRAEFPLVNDNIETRKLIEAWVEPGEVEWTVIGLAEGAIGARTVADRMEVGDNFDSDLGEKARMALYAKGRVLGRYLVTLAYDTAKQEDEQRLLGTLDPNAYYTVFGDASTRQFDAASREKLYLRVESARFNAAYGDFQTGFTDTQLGRYQRTATGISFQAQAGQFGAEGFAAKIGTRRQRKELQGTGLSGPYPLARRDLVPNSETVTIEVRDRFRSQIIVSSRQLTRFIDYDIDPLAGTITFASPVTSRDADFNPRFIVIEYETAGTQDGDLNAGFRLKYATLSGDMQLGATLLTDSQDGERTNIMVADVTAQIAPQTELRAEVARSQNSQATAYATILEVQHQSEDIDVLGYYRSVESDFGVGQVNGSESGRVKFGLDANVRLGDEFNLVSSIWQDRALLNDARRRAASANLEYRSASRDLRVGFARFEDRLSDGSANISALAEISANQRLFKNRLQLGVSSGIVLDGPESLDLPNRHRLDARFSLTPDVRLVAGYEIANGEGLNSQTLRAGFELSPWNGGQIISSLNSASIKEAGDRTYAAFGLAQSLQVTPSLTVDATIDSNIALNSAPTIEVAPNLDSPFGNAGAVGVIGRVVEDFTAVTLGGTWRRDRWNVTARGEYRDGSVANRMGASFGIIRQLGEGQVLGGQSVFTRASDTNGVGTQILNASLNYAYRPPGSALSMLGKLEYRSDEVTGAVRGAPGPTGRTALTVDGDAASRRLLASLSSNWSPRGRALDGSLISRDELSLFLGARYGNEVLDNLDIDSFTALVGLDGRLGFTSALDIGVRGTLRANLSADLYSYSYGPYVSVVPAEGLALSVGYNVDGFDDADFEAIRQTNRGVWLGLQLAFDESLFGLINDNN